MKTKNTDMLDCTFSRRDMLRHIAVGLMAGLVSPTLLTGSALAAPADSRKNYLTVYYSRSGNTQIMARYIQEEIKGDLVRIETVHPYPTDYTATTRQARKELDSGFKPPITTKIDKLSSYDVVFVGSPCWWGTIATPVITFLSTNDLSGKTVVPFMTHKGSGLGRTQSRVQSLCPKSKVLDGLAIWGDDIGSSRKTVVTWLQDLSMIS